MFKRVGIFIVSCLFLMASAFAQDKPTPHHSKKFIEIGAIYNLTGRLSPLDLHSAHGAELAIHQINKSGGILGRQVKLILRNGRSHPKTIEKIAKNFAKDPNISVVIGLNDSNMVALAAPIIAAANKVFLSSGATSFDLTKKVPTYLFLICFSNNVQAAAAAEYIYDFLHLKQGVILYDQETEYGNAMTRYFSERYAELGGKIALTRPVKPGDYRITDQIKAIKKLKEQPQFIYMPVGPTDGPYLIKTLRRAGIDLPIVGGDSFTAPEIIKVAGRYANNVSFTTHGVVNTDFINLLPALMRQYVATERFFKAHRKFYKKMPSNVFTALGYDSVNLLASAIKQAKSADPHNIIEALHHLDPYIGVTGKISYINRQTVPIKTVSIIRIMRGRADFMGNWIPVKVPKLKMVTPTKPPKQ